MKTAALTADYVENEEVLVKTKRSPYSEILKNNGDKVVLFCSKDQTGTKNTVLMSLK